MYKFIRCFLNAWVTYPQHCEFCNNHFTAEQMKTMVESDAERGIKQPRNRFEYALMIAKIHYAHRDRYGKKCLKFNGDCEKCNAKHC